MYLETIVYLHTQLYFISTNKIFLFSMFLFSSFLFSSCSAHVHVTMWCAEPILLLDTTNSQQATAAPPDNDSANDEEYN